MTDAGYHSNALSATEVQLLGEIGLMACGAGNTKAARAIFEGLRILRPDQPLCLIGLAMSSLETGSPQDMAAILLESGHLPVARHAEFQVFLAMSLFAAGRRNESAGVLRNMLSVEQGESPALRLARELLRTYVANYHVIPPMCPLPEQESEQ